MRFFSFFRRDPAPQPSIFTPHVGSRVVTPKGNIGNVRAIVGDEAWVKTGGKGQNVVCRTDLLRQPEI